MIDININVDDLDFNELNKLPVPASLVPAYYVLKKMFNEYIADQIIQEICKVESFYKTESDAQ